MEGTNAKWCHAKSAADVRDAKPEGDVHSNLPKQRSLLENNGFLSIKFSLSGGSKYKVLETRLRWRGRMRLEPCQNGSIRPRRQALGRRTLPLPRPWSHLGNTMVSQLEFMSNWMDLGICLRWRGRVRLEPCQIGSTRPRRQARGRRSLHPFKSIRFDMFHSLTNMWRFGFGVRENVGKGGKKKGARPCTARPSFTMFFQNVFHSAVLEPTHHCGQKKRK